MVLGTTLAIGGLLVTGGMLLMGLGALGLAIPAANTALAAFGITATITGASIKAGLLSAFWPVTIGIAAIYALKKAWDSNLGGIQNKVATFWHSVSTIWNGISSLISSGKLSDALHNELQKMGLWAFVKSIYMVYYRLSQFFSGVYQQVKSAFSTLGEAFYPVFSTIWGIIAPVGKILFSLAQALGLVGSAVPSSAFMAFGQVIGWLVGTPLKMLAWGAMINHLRHISEPCHILTVEDPVERAYRDDIEAGEVKAIITSREVGIDTPNMKSALKAALRQTPNAILIGEIRDRQSMAVALEASQTGHLVFATLHTMGAVETINRIVSLLNHEQEHNVRKQLAEALRCIISQQLVRRAYTEAEKLAVVEVLVNTTDIRNILSNEKWGEKKAKKITAEMDKDSHELGMQTMQAHLNRLVRYDLIDIKEAMRVGYLPN